MKTKVRRQPTLITITDYSEPCHYDGHGRMTFHKDYHPNHKAKWSFEELAYLATFYEHDGRNHVGLALGRTDSTVSDKYSELKRSNQLEKYKKFYH